MVNTEVVSKHLINVTHNIESQMVTRDYSQNEWMLKWIDDLIWNSKKQQQQQELEHHVHIYKKSKWIWINMVEICLNRVVTVFYFPSFIASWELTAAYDFFCPFVRIEFVKFRQIYERSQHRNADDYCWHTSVRWYGENFDWVANIYTCLWVFAF